MLSVTTYRVDALKKKKNQGSKHFTQITTSAFFGGDGEILSVGNENKAVKTML